ncbi:MAG: LysE family translocator [Pseudomonadota bacterium]
MTSLMVLSGILGALLLGAMSPGPSFVLVSKIAIAGSRRDGVSTALGMGVGGAIFAALALIGLITLLQQVEWLYLTVKICGGLYLVFLGIRIWRHARGSLVLDPREQGPTSNSLRRSFFLGLATQLANPKTAVVYASVFAALLPSEPSQTLLVMLPISVLLLEFGWYTLVAVAFSNPVPQGAYLRGKKWFDRLAGGVLGALGVRLIAEEARW